MKYMNVEQILKSGKYPFSMGQIKKFINERNVNGLEKAARKIGKRMYINMELFDEWIESSYEKNNS